MKVGYAKNNKKILYKLTVKALAFILYLKTVLQEVAMKVIDIKFTKEHDSKRQQAQAEMMQKLSERLSQRIEDKFSDVRIRVRLSSSSGLDVSGFRDTEKKQVMEWLEDVWNDPFLLDD